MPTTLIESDLLAVGTTRVAARADEEGALFARIANGDDPRARELLIERFLPLARSVALRYRRCGESADDLVQIASIGLIKAIDRFDPARGLRFSTYAVPTIVGEIKRYVRDRTWAVRVPRTLQSLTGSVERAVGELAAERRGEPSVAAIAVRVGASEEAVLEALQAATAHRAISLDAPRRADEHGNTTTLADCIRADEHGFDRAEDRATLDGLLRTIGERERAVLDMRFRLDMTQVEIADAIGASQMYVSRLLRGSLERLRLATAQQPAGDLRALRSSCR